ncbi:MAG: hypothetical protein OQK24_06765 [Magnetovibrio sp.]|nr:hypothetical protein [Magnetovibrio sp.]
MRLDMTFQAVITTGLVCAALTTTASTAAAQNNQTTQVLNQTEIAAVPPMPLKMRVAGSCGDQGATFHVQNAGHKWPRSALVKLYYADDKTIIGQRRLRLDRRQRITLAVKARIQGQRPIAIWVEPSWYKRNFKFDTTLLCS